MNTQNKPTRREFMKWTALIGGAISTVAIFSFTGKTLLDKQKRANRLMKSTKEHVHGRNQWFTQKENALIGVLAALIIPSDETGPGALDAHVATTLDGIVLKSHAKQLLYKKGLDAFDEIAQREYGPLFSELTHDQQIDILHLVDIPSGKSYAPGRSLFDKIRRKVTGKTKYLYYKHGKMGGLGAAVDLFPVLTKDVMQAFYTSPVAWNWLGYDGPPQPQGYLGRLSPCSTSILFNTAHNVK
ncbi:MAG: hypothetical protein JETT_2900 [Candidatus Jettenia ecosi]|uniref:Gluconate 2-dehydrogenase subunit 3 family protein n=1 Tax=Candidatus Jettenia ecosi TaxID=2494326 RepID=A0A533QJT4_9BACT|nr:MAG: hypothetical protein JETT_2900 [Candidatus Jettenia ecosi]